MASAISYLNICSIVKPSKGVYHLVDQSAFWQSLLSASVMGGLVWYRLPLLEWRSDLLNTPTLAGWLISFAVVIYSILAWW